MLRDQTDRKGPAYALIAAALFGASTPLAKILLGQTPPILLAALLYLGSGLGLTIWLVFRRLLKDSPASEAALKVNDLPWLGGAIISGGMAIILLKDNITVTLGVAAALMLAGVWLHLTERHEHEHVHVAMEHEHRHSHDEHHRHHDDPELLAQTHSHMHRHERMRHSHPHYPDIHHRHEH